MTLSWLLHMDSHLDVSVAYFAAGLQGGGTDDDNHGATQQGRCVFFDRHLFGRCRLLSHEKNPRIL